MWSYRTTAGIDTGREPNIRSQGGRGDDPAAFSSLQGCPLVCTLSECEIRSWGMNQPQIMDSQDPNFSSLFTVPLKPSTGVVGKFKGDVFFQPTSQKTVGSTNAGFLRDVGPFTAQLCFLKDIQCQTLTVRQTGTVALSSLSHANKD